MMCFCVSVLNGILYRYLFKMRRSRIGLNPPLFMGTMKYELLNPAFILAGGTVLIAFFTSRTVISLHKTWKAWEVVG